MEIGQIIKQATEEGAVQYFRNGIKMEKGAILNAERIERNRELYEFWCNLWVTHADLFLDLITPENDNFSLFFYQRIFLRAAMRYRYNYCIAPRAFSKTFISIVALFLKCIFLPGSKIFLCSPTKVQAAKVARQKILEIYQHWPILKKEIVGNEISDTPGNFG